MPEYPIDILVRAYREVRTQVSDDDAGDDALRVVLRSRFPGVSEEQIRAAESQAMREDEGLHKDRLVAVMREIEDAHPNASEAELRTLFRVAVQNDDNLVHSMVRAALPKIREELERRERVAAKEKKRKGGKR